MSRMRALLAAVVVFALAGLVGGVLLEAGPFASLRGPVQARKRMVDEKEDDAPKRPKKKIKPIDEEKPPAPTPVTEAVDLAQAHRDATHEGVKGLYRELLVPSDRVELKKFAKVKLSGDQVLGGTVRVEPLPGYFKTRREIRAAVPVEIIDDAGKSLKSDKFAPGQIEQVRYYELIALDEVKKFYANLYERGDKANARYLNKHDQYVAAEVALSAVLRWHQSARERKVRQGAEWSEVEDRVREELLGALLSRLDLLIKAKSWDPAFELTRHLTDTFRRPKEHARIAKPVGDLISGALADENYPQERRKEARLRLRQFENQFPDSEVIKPISNSLREQAEAFFERAKALEKDGKKAEAIALLVQAEEAWPDLPGLQAFRIRLEGDYQILRVGVRESPRYVSPAWAATESEKRAVDLLFESLVNLTPDEKGVLYYRPGLAEGRFQVVPLGRQFKLPRHARWSDGEEMTAGDISFSVDELKEGRSTGRAGDWGELLRSVRVEGDPYRVKLLLRQGFLDPLALMSFKVLPNRGRPHPDSEDFAKKPITSGPFELAGQDSENGRPYVRFTANPHYRARLNPGTENNAGKDPRGGSGRPILREVRMFPTSDPVKDLTGGVINLALDLTAAQAAQLRKAGFEVPLPGEATVNRRIYFLAVNNDKKGVGLNNPDLRIALARAINREALLDQHFRDPGLDPQAHRSLNGPYPARSWALNPKLAKEDKPLDPHDADLAKTKFKQALAKLNVKELSLTLKYPAGDKALAEAMTDLCGRVSSALPGLKLTAQEREPHALREDVEKLGDYHLAYWCYDFPDETFWLMPLLGPKGKHGTNLLRYNGKLVGRVQTATNSRHFADVRKLAHAIHQEHLESEMPFIPLWQLDPLYAYRKGKIEMPPFDANRIFAQIEQWKMR